MPRKHKKANKQLFICKKQKKKKKKKIKEQISFFLDTFMKKQKKKIDFFFLDAFKAIKSKHLNKQLFLEHVSTCLLMYIKNVVLFVCLCAFFLLFVIFLYMGFLCKKMKSPNYLIYITTR